MPAKGYQHMTRDERCQIHVLRLINRWITGAKGNPFAPFIRTENMHHQAEA